jgi:3-deoxy-D-manno-octulosonate 8-phosphate phosphatase (KDO 8-P phosphatase)
MSNEEIVLAGSKIKLLLSDVDGVLTDAGVYYTADGELMKRFSIRDGMGVERLLNLAGIETGIITGELSGSVQKRAEKLKISELHLGIKDKLKVLHEIMERKQLQADQIAFIGDDVNDLEILQHVGLAACPADAMDMVKEVAHFICTKNGGNGAFRELAEWLIEVKE